MRIPAVRERVRVDGRRGTFLVMAVDRDRQVADLIPTASEGTVEEDVPFAVIVQQYEARGDARED